MQNAYGAPRNGQQEILFLPGCLRGVREHSLACYRHTKLHREERDNDRLWAVEASFTERESWHPDLVAMHAISQTVQHNYSCCFIPYSWAHETEMQQYCRLKLAYNESTVAWTQAWIQQRKAFASKRRHNQILHHSSFFKTQVRKQWCLLFPPTIH